MPILVFERGDKKGKSLKLEPGKRYVFGRDPANAVTLTDPLTSRRHFEVREEGGVFRLVDLESTNGTYLNDEPVDTAELKVGDKIQAGETIVSFLTDQKEETAQGLVGKTIGGYKILERVGRGGMGTVYKANQLSLNRIVAFKVLSARLLKDGKFIDRFKSEARSAGQLNHPNIVQVYDVGTDGGLHFFSMEFMDGGSLQDELGRDGKLSWEDTLDTLMQASRALIFAERKDIIHRDVKPDNLMRTSDGQIKLADLGLARKGNGTKSDEEGIFGTPHFISPEQAQGKEIDHRADLYSLGATAYRLLAGRTPFLGTNIKEIITQQITAEPPPLRQFCPDAPEELLAVVAKLMQKNPDDRYATADEAFADLEKIRLKYHLKVAGAGGGGKGVLVAVGIALVAVVGVVVFALSQGKGEENGNVVYVPPPATGTQNNTQIPNGPDPSEVREVRAENAFLNVGRAEAPLMPLAQTALRKKKDWLQVAADYEKVADDADFKETKAAAKARARAKKIRDTVREQEEAEKQKIDRAQKLWDGLRTGVHKLLEEKKFSEAMKLVDETKKHEDMRFVDQHLSSAKEQIDTWTSSARGSISDLFQRAWTQVKRDADDLRKAGKYAEAAAKLREFLGLAAADDTRPPFGPADAEAQKLVAGWREELQAKLVAMIEADRHLYFRTCRAVRHHAGASGDGPNPVFDFDFLAAAAAFEGLLSEDGPGLVSEVYQEAARTKIEHYRTIDSLMQTLVDRLNDGKLLDEALAFPDRFEPGEGVTLEFDRKRESVATRKELHYRRRIVRSGIKADSAETKEWREFTPAELWEFMFLRGARFAMSPKDHAAAALFLTETGLTLGVEDLITAAGDALSPEQRERIRREVAAIRAWREVIEVSKTRPPEEWSVAAARFVENHARSDWFIMVYGFDTPGDKALLPPDLVQAWIDERLKALDW